MSTLISQTSPSESAPKMELPTVADVASIGGATASGVTPPQDSDQAVGDTLVDRLYAAPPPTGGVSGGDGGGRTVDSVSSDTRRTAKVLTVCTVFVSMQCQAMCDRASTLLHTECNLCSGGIYCGENTQQS